MKLIRYLLLGLAVALVWGLAFRNIILKNELERVLKAQTGFGLKLDRVRLGLHFNSFEIDGARLSNPADFPDREALEIKQVRVEYSFWSLFSREIHFSEVILDIPKLVMVRKADGETNTQRLSGAGHKEGGSGAGSGGESNPAPEKKKKEPPGFRIDRLVLRVGTVETRDYSKAQPGGEPAVRTMTLNVDQEHHDVTSLGQLSGLVMGGAFTQMLGHELNDPESNLNKKLKKAAGSIQKSLQGLFGEKKE